MRKQKHRRPAQPDIHVAIGQVRDHSAMAGSCATDAAADRKWFEQHPDRIERQRLVTNNEVLAVGCPPGTIVVVQRMSDGSQARLFLKGDNWRN